MVEKASVDTIIKHAESRAKKSANPTLIEELFLAALLQELNISKKNTRPLFSAFYCEIVKPLMFMQTKSKILWFAMNWLYTQEEYASIDCENIIVYFSTPAPALRVDTFTGRHDSFSNANPDSSVTAQTMIDYVNTLCAKEVKFLASQYLSMWRAASAEKIRAAKINQVKVRYDQTQNPDAFFSGMAELEKEYRSALEPSKMHESKSIGEMELERLATVMGSTTPKNHFIPTAELDLNKHIFGFPRGGSSLITGVTGGGKSLHILRHAVEAAKAGFQILYISIEMTEQRILRELMTIWGVIPNSEIESVTTGEELKELSLVFLERAKSDLKKNKGAFYYDICIDVELTDLLDIVRVHASTLDIDVVYIDLYDEIPLSVELQSNPNGKGGFYEVMNRSFIELGREYDMAIVGAVQLKAEAVLNGKIQQEAIGGSVWYSKKSSLILYSHRSSDELLCEDTNTYMPLYAIEVMKDRESGKGAKGYQVVRFLDRDTKKTFPAPQFKNIAQVDKRIAKEQKDDDSRY